MQENYLTTLAEHYPFITICTYAGVDYVGIVQNQDTSVTSLYDYSAITNSDARKRFLELGDAWWWGSNRIVPIHLFLRHEWHEFKPFLKTFVTKNLTILHGPICSIHALGVKKSKRKGVIMVRKIP